MWINKFTPSLINIVNDNNYLEQRKEHENAYVNINTK